MVLVAIIRGCEICGSEYKVPAGPYAVSISKDDISDSKTPYEFDLREVIENSGTDLCPVCYHAFEDVVSGRRVRGLL